MIKQGMNILKQNEKKRLDFQPELKQINFLDRRVYKRSEGVYYPSVTTILQYMPKNKFFESWLKDVGHSADLIMRRAGKEGTQVHEAAEALVLGQEVSWMDDYGNAKYSQIVWEMILKFHDFWKTHKPELISAEDFVYSDETTEQRIWYLKKTGEQAWNGTAKGVIGQAEGLEDGDTFYWNYTIDLPVPDGTMRVTFDDYMWLISEDRMLNKAYMSKFGVPLGEVTIMFEKL